MRDTPSQTSLRVSSPAGPRIIAFSWPSRKLELAVSSKLARRCHSREGSMARKVSIRGPEAVVAGFDGERGVEVSTDRQTAARAHAPRRRGLETGGDPVERCA